VEVKPGAPVHLVRGDDEVLVRDAAREVVHALAADLDPGLAVEEVGRDRFTAPDTGDATIVPLVEAAHTPPFLTERRVVVGRDLELFTRAAQVAPLVDYLADPLPTTSLVLVWHGGRLPRSLVEAVKACRGVQIDASPGRKVAGWVDDQVSAAGLTLDRAATDRVLQWLGDDPPRLVGLLGTLAGSFGAGARLGAADIEPYLGEAGGVPPWELTDALDRGNIPIALAKLRRLTAGGGRHALQIMATLHGHYGRMLALDGAAVGGERDAAALLGMKGSTFPARKALAQARKLGHDRVVRAMDLLAAADLDLRGGKAWPDDLVLEVLVARLARLSR
jgi:DNA polymerase-3 subunit delta